MGLVNTAYESMHGAISDLWREYFYCNSIPNDVLLTRALKKRDSKSKNNGNDSVISNGSIIAVNDGQCAIITDNGEIKELCMFPGEYVYSKSTEPSLLCDQAIKSSFNAAMQRFAFGNTVQRDQRVYYINTKEIPGMGFGTSSPIMFRVVDNRAGIDVDIRLKLCGVFSFKIADPVLFYTSIVGNVENEYKTEQISRQLRTEFLAALNPAMSQMSARGIRYSELLLYSQDITDVCREVLKTAWQTRRGIELLEVALESVTPIEEDVQMIQQLQKNATFADARLANANMMGAQMDAMRNASSNSAGAMTGFMGMGMASMMGGMFSQQRPQYTEPPRVASQPRQPSQGVEYKQSYNRTPLEEAIDQMDDGQWTCVCGRSYSMEYDFCPKCGSKRS